MLKFEIKAKEDKARTGNIKIGAKEVSTPLFVPQSSGLAVPAMFPESVKESGTEMLFADTYRLLMRSGLDVVKAAGGIKPFTGWQGIVFSDSGSTGVYRTDVYRKAKEEGLFYASYIDGSRHKITPEYSVSVQEKLGSDIILGLYEEASLGGNRMKIGKLLRRTARWNRRTKDAFHPKGDQAFFGVITGGAYADLRESSLKLTVPLKPDGFLQAPPLPGENRKAWLRAVAASTMLLPEDKPCAVLGLQSIPEILECIASGMDLLISDIAPLKGLSGIALTDSGEMDFHDNRYFSDSEPLMSGCPCPACRSYTKAYLHHLTVAGELLGSTLLTWHNLVYMNRLFQSVHKAINSGCFADFMKAKGL
ncbi:MAG: queuine tRNA-ribosyltransferase family protein [Alphaproteobacteria bacterium]|nr:queuine tRNA-ribosyltransferase family protein [Alphaproteobacteria bacterium]